MRPFRRTQCLRPLPRKPLNQRGGALIISKRPSGLSLHARHHQNATPIQRVVDRTTGLLGRPRFIGVLTVIAAGWISLNLLAAALGYRPIDPPPFPGLGFAVSLVSLYIVVLILATQRREYQLAQLREQLTLELAILSEQETAKVIQLLEELNAHPKTLSCLNNFC